MVSLKAEVIIRAVLLVILISLCFAVYYNGKDLKCSDCQVQFENILNSGSLQYKEYLNVSIEELYNQFKLNESCPLRFMKGRGFYYANSTGTN